MGTPETQEALGVYPPWDGGPDRQLPPGAYTDHIDLLEDLRDLDGFPEEANLEVFELLKGYRITRIRTAEFAVSDEGHGLIILWLPYYEDQRMFEPGDHTPISVLERWRDTEIAFGVLASACPGRPVQFAFLHDEEGIAPAWNEWPYELPPEYLIGWWPSEDAE
jgi:hypothetical protein